MLINKIKFLNVPFDRAHTNIIGDVQDVNGVSNALHTMTSSIQSVEFTTPISVKVSDDDFILSLPVAQYNLTNGKYNYAIVYGTTGALYYFIPNYTSLFDGSNKQSSLKFEFDEYLNNYYEILTAEKQIATRSHIIDVQHYSESGGTIVANPKNNVFPTQVPLKEVSGGVFSITSDVVDSTVWQTSTRYIVLWARIYTDGSIYAGSTTQKTATNTYIGVDSTPVLFYPYAVVDTSNFTISNNILWVWEGNEYKTYTSNYIINPLEAILEVDLTAYPPFLYTLERSGNIFVIDTSDYADALPVYDSTQANYITNPLGGGASLIYNVKSAHIRPTLYMTLLLPQIGYEKTSKPIEYHTKKYPNYQYIYYANGNRNAFVPMDKTEAIEISIFTTYQIPYMVYKYYDNQSSFKEPIYTSLPIPLNNKGSLPTSASQYNIYQRSKSNQIIAESNAQIRNLAITEAKGASSIGMGLALGLPFATGSGMFTMVEGANNFISYTEALDAKMADLRNAQNTFNIPTANANGDIVQDYLLVRTMIPVLQEEAEAVAQNINEYGYESTRYISPLQQLCDCWDYIRTSGCSFPQIGNLRQRRVCEEFFNRGTTKWNFNHDSFNNDYLSCILKMRKESSNNIKVGLIE